MKKHGNRANVLKLKHRARKKKKLRQVDRFSSQVKNFLFMEDEAPSREWVRASDVYLDYVNDCLSDDATYCKQLTFAKIASVHLDKFKGTDGHMYYRPSPPLYNYLLSLRSHGEEVKKAA